MRPLKEKEKSGAEEAKEEAAIQSTQ